MSTSGIGPDGTPVLVATWNLENLFLPGGESGPTTQQIYDAKLDALADTMAALDADVWGVQEVGDLAALDDLVDRIAARGGPRLSAEVSQAPDGRGIRVAVLTRLKVASRADVVDLPDRLAGVTTDGESKLVRMGRGALSVTLTVPGTAGPLTVVVAHLKSKLLSYPGGRFTPRDEDERTRVGMFAVVRRAAEAATLRHHADDVLEGQGRERALVVMGDLNDTPGAATTQLLLGPSGSELGTDGAFRPDKGDGSRLWNLAPLMPPGADVSRVFRGTGELIDHLLVSRALLDGVAGARTVPVRPVEGGTVGLPSVTEDPTPRRRATDSDHAPVLATLTVR